MKSLLAVLILLGASHARAQEPVDVALVLALDASVSVDEAEFALQTEGLAHAFEDPAVQAAIAGGPRGAVAVTVLLWSRYGASQAAVPWMLLDGAPPAAALAARLRGVRRTVRATATSISGALGHALQSLEACPCAPARRVIDLSGDGRHNQGPPLAPAREAAARQNVTVNALAILSDVPTLHFYFARYVATGPDAFVETAQSYDAYARAMRRKLLREIRGPAFARTPRAPAGNRSLGASGEGVGRVAWRR